nr:hypothetical protein Iba_chr14dCG12270 [Ipomoea batatas]
MATRAGESMSSPLASPTPAGQSSDTQVNSRKPLVTFSRILGRTAYGFGFHSYVLFSKYPSTSVSVVFLLIKVSHSAALNQGPIRANTRLAESCTPQYSSINWPLDCLASLPHGAEALVYGLSLAGVGCVSLTHGQTCVLYLLSKASHGLNWRTLTLIRTSFRTAYSVISGPRTPVLSWNLARGIVIMGAHLYSAQTRALLRGEWQYTMGLAVGLLVLRRYSPQPGYSYVNVPEICSDSIVKMGLCASLGPLLVRKP